MSSDYQLLSHRAPVFIAEIGVNHNGDLRLAKKLIDCARAIGANFVKFQSFHTSLLVCNSVDMAPYQRDRSAGNSQAEMLKMLELSKSQQIELFEYACKKEIDFLSTPFDTDSLNFLVRQLNLPVIKIGSGDITDVRLLYEAGASNRNILISTGMSDIEDIWTALHAIFAGRHGLSPSVIGRNSETERQKIRDWAITKDSKLTLLHCVSAYPAPAEDLNLRAIEFLNREFGMPIGYSDHSVGIEAALHAITLGAVVIEKHLTISRSMPGPDHQASTEPEEFAEMIEKSRTIGSILGKRGKLIAPSEAVNANFARKGLYAKERITKGTPFSEQNITALRPPGHTSASHYYRAISSISERDYEPGESIVLDV